MGKSVRQFDEDGLPIPTGNHADTDVLDKEGLPIPKKKDVSAGSVSPSVSSPNPGQTGPPVDTSGSAQKQLTQNYKNNSLTPKDVSNEPLGEFIGPSPEQISHSINNKGENIRKITKAPTVVNITKAVSEHKDVQDKMTQLSTRQSMVGDVKDYSQQMANLKSQEMRVRSSIQKSYDAQKETIVPELVNNLKDNFSGANWNEVYANEKKDENGVSSPVAIDAHLKWDSETHKLTPKSVEYVAKHVDDYMNKKGDDVVNAQVSGDLDKKQRTYSDLTRSVVDELNKVPVRKKQEEFTEEYTTKNPKLKEAVDAQKRANEYFSKENVDAVKAKVNTERDKEFIKTQERFYGKGGLFQSNNDFIGVQEKYAQLVADGKMTPEVAQKQINAEIGQNPALKKLRDNFENEIKKINEQTQDHWQRYLIDGLQKNNPGLTVYKDGSVGVAGLSKDQYTNMMEGYEEGMDSIAKKMLGEQDAAVMKQANEKAKKQGAFVGSLLGATNEMASGLSKFIFNKTQWGGERVRHFEANEIAAPDINQSDVAATWNWKGLESLKDPNFWMSKIGSMVPVIAGTAAVGTVTEGEGMPEYISWLSSAGIFTAQSGLSTYNQLLNTRDAQGNLLTEADAAHFMARDMEKNFLPNVLMMAVTSGTLLKAKNIVKPTLAGAVGKGIAGAAAAQPFFTWQGYESYANMLEAQGKKADFWDYMQSKDFKDNLINGLVVGGGLSFLHAPGQYMKSMDNWTKMVHTSEGEFRNLIPQNYALQQEMAGGGKSLRDALTLHVFNTDPSTLDEAGKRELADKKSMLKYSVNLDRNIKSANLDPTKINDLYQAHNLALADQNDFLADQNKDNKSLSSLYSDKAKEYREQAKAVADGDAKFHYLTNEEGQPIFMSDKSFKTLDQEGTISKWILDQTVYGVHSSEEPDFAQRYKDHIEAKNEAQVEGKTSEYHISGLIKENKDKLGVLYEGAKANPEQFLKDVADQVFGRNADGSISLRPDAEVAARTQYGDDIVDMAKVMYPEKEPPPAPEKPTVQSAIIKVGNKIYEGENHGEAIDKAEAAGEDVSGIDREKDGLFKVSDGRIIDREEAKKEFGADHSHELITPEYKPQINDDPFANQFFPEGSPERAEYDKLDQKGKDKMIDDKRAELKGQSGISVIKPGEIKKPEIVPLATEKAPEVKPEEPAKEEPGESVKEDPESQKPDEGVTPPPPVVGPSEEGLHPRDNEWTSIQKKDLSERVQKENAFTQTNKETVDNVISRVSRDASANGRTWQSQVEFEVNALHNDFFNEDGSIKQAFNPTTDQLALIGMRLMDINGESSIAEFNPNDDQQTARNAYLENEKMKAERLLSFGEAGRAFQFRQSLLKMGINGDIQIKRKAISSMVGIKIPETAEQFNELSDFDKKRIKPVYDAFQSWKAEYEKENKARTTIDEKYSQEEFDKRIKAAVKDALKDAKVPDKGSKITKERASKLSDNLKSFADKFEKFGRADLPEGTQKAGFGPDIQKKIADAIRWVAEKIANGDFKVPELIYEAIEKFKGGDLKDSDLSDNIKKALSEAGVDDKTLNGPTNREGILGKMKEIAKNAGAKSITKDMVDKGLVRDYLHDIAKRGETDSKDILEKGVKELSEAFPGTDAKTLRDAYLKEGAFTPDKSKDLEDQIKKSTDTFHDITVLQRDIEALEAGSELYGADKETKGAIISDYEKNLKDQKEKIIKDKSDAIRRNKDEYSMLESERNRQLRKLGELKGKLSTLELGQKPTVESREPGKDTPEIEEVKTRIKEAERKISKDKADRKSEYNKLESERNRQLKVVSDLQEKLKMLKSGKRLVGSKSEYKEDVPEIETLKDEIYKADEDLRKTESALKAAQKKAEKVAEYDRRIRDLDNHKKVWDRAKSGKQVDKDLAAKREELRKTLIKNGVKLETGSKNARQTKEKVIQAHNDRVNNLKGKITDLLNDDTVPDEDKKVLRAIQSSLDKMNVKIDAGELDDKIKKAIATSGKLHTDNITNLVTGRKSEIFKDLKDLSTQLKKDNNSGLQDIQLNQLKNNEISRKEQAERDLAAGKFEDVPKLSDYKKDEELLKLTRDRKMAESNLAREVDRYQKQNQSFWQRQVTRLQRLQRANLISGIMTNGKVLVATVVKPVSDALVRRTVGTLTAPIFKSLGLKGEREALNNDATIKSFVDSFKGMTQREAAEKRGTAETGLEKATTDLQAASDQLKALETQYGKGKPEYQQYKDNEYTKAVNDFQAAQYDWAASMMYDFISPRAWKERLNILQSGVSSFEESMGGHKGQTWADEKSQHIAGTIANKIIHTLEIFGRVHGAEKDISARQAFVEGFLKRAAQRIKAGEQLTPSKLEGIALESYPNFLGGKFQNKNPVSDAIRGAEMKASESGGLGKAFAFWLKSVTPVLKVPLNIEAEGLFKYTVGLPVAIGKTFYEIGKALKANDLTIKDGIKDFNGTMESVRDHMQQLSPEKRDLIIQYANKGIFGAAMALITGSMAASGNLVFGGAYGPGRKKRKYLDADTGDMEELNYGEIVLNGHKLGKFWSAVVMHLPPLMPAVMSATYVQKYKDERGDLKDEKDKAAAAFDGLSEVVRTAWEESALKSLGDVAESPGNIFNSFTTQMAGKNISEFYDTDENGNLIERKGENAWDKILLRTGGRKFVPTKEQYDTDKEEKQQEGSDKATELRENDPYYEKNQK